MSSSTRKVFVGMSGGVDSSVAALLLKEQGHDVTGVYLKCWSQARLDELGVPGECPSERDAEDARRVANHLNIPFYVFDLEDEYRKRVVDYLVDGYRRGVTPNPDVVCNREIKFGLFLEKARALGAEFVATGHYARLRPHVPPGADGSVAPAATDRLHSRRAESPDKRHQAPRTSESRPLGHAGSLGLWEAKDKNKDQSYFLWTLGQDQLAHALFPIGDLLKSEVREIARKAGVPTADKKDSQGICFLGDVALADFVARHIPERPGDIVTVDGVKVGEHRGAHLYTIGQRHGLDIGAAQRALGRKGATASNPFYVTGTNITANTVTVAEGDDHPALYRTEVVLTDINLVTTSSMSASFAVAAQAVSGATPKSQPSPQRRTMSVFARVRYRQPLAPAELVRDEDFYKLVFKKPVKFVAPGQSAVWYSAEGELLGGGVIV